jgi:drug/metabolite transporter (DMT)-like permease
MASPSAARPDRVTLIAFAGVVLFGGLNAVAVRQTVLEIAPEWGAAIRFLAAGAIFVALAAVGRRPFPRGRSFVGAMAYGAVGFAASFGLIYPALRTVQAGTGSVVLALAPLATYGLAVAQRQERFRVEALVGALVALAGIAIVFVDQLSADVPVGPLAMIFVGMVCLSESGIIVKWVPRADPLATNAVAMLTGGVILLAASLVTGEAQAIPARMSTWLAVGYITVFGSVVMFGLYLYGLRRWTASAMSYSTLMLPFVSVTAATLLTGEAFSLAFLAGGLVMVAGVYVGAFGRRHQRAAKTTSLPECFPVHDCPEPLATRAATSPVEA